MTVGLVEGRVVIEHDCLGDQVEATLNNTEWTVVTESPLTVQPSVGCDRCGLHGWIASGEFWGSAAPLATVNSELMVDPPADRSQTTGGTT